MVQAEAQAQLSCNVCVHGCRSTTLERQDLSRTYLAHHELESKFIVVIFIFIR